MCTSMSTDLNDLILSADIRAEYQQEHDMEQAEANV